MADRREARMRRRTKNTPVNIQHELRGSEELAEDLVKTRALPDVPLRLGMMHRDDPVELWHTAIPCSPIGEVGAYKLRNVTSRVVSKFRRNHIPYDHVALGMELQPIVVLDPMTE